MDLMAYRDRYGPINPVRQYDRGSAVVAQLIALANGAKDAQLQDFLPYGVDRDAID